MISLICISDEALGCLINGPVFHKADDVFLFSSFSNAVVFSSGLSFNFFLTVDKL